MDAGAVIAEFLELLEYAQKRYAAAMVEEQDANAETQDILHALEFRWNDPRKTARLIRTLGDIRRKRRWAKDDMEIANLILSFRNNNAGMVKALQRLQGDVRTALQHQAQRSYQFRTDVMEEYLKPEDSPPPGENEPESGGGQDKEAHSE